MSETINDSDLYLANRRFYDPLWAGARLVEPERFNTWPLVQSLLKPDQKRLEVAPGLRPRLPLQDTQFVDISPPALNALQQKGANATAGSITALPLTSDQFGLICAFDIVEHVSDDNAALRELARVATPGATLILSVPLHPSWWTRFDAIVGHYRRYEPDEIVAKLGQNGFSVTHSALYGMKPRSSKLVDLGMWMLEHYHASSMWWYNRVGMPIALRRQKPLQLHKGFIDTQNAGEALLICSFNG